MFRLIARRVFQAPAAALRHIQAPSITPRQIQVSFITPRQMRAPVIASHQIRCMASANRSPEGVSLASVERVLEKLHRDHEYIDKVADKVAVAVREVQARQEKARRDAIFVSGCILAMAFCSVLHTLATWNEANSPSRQVAKTKTSQEGPIFEDQTPRDAPTEA